MCYQSMTEQVLVINIPTYRCMCNIYVYKYVCKCNKTKVLDFPSILKYYSWATTLAFVF